MIYILHVCWVWSDSIQINPCIPLPSTILPIICLADSWQAGTWCKSLTVIIIFSSSSGSSHLTSGLTAQATVIPPSRRQDAISLSISQTDAAIQSIPASEQIRWLSFGQNTGRTGNCLLDNSLTTLYFIVNHHGEMNLLNNTFVVMMTVNFLQRQCYY